jgi:hypothetical protein
MKTKQDAKTIKEAIATTKTVAQGEMTIRTATSSGSMINNVRRIIKERIVNTHAMKARVMISTLTKTMTTTMPKETPRANIKRVVIALITLRMTRKGSQLPCSCIAAFTIEVERI